MYIVGLTGGIGSGKTTASDMFAHLGVPVIDTDIIARELVGPGQPALAEIVAKFGPDVLLKNGELDRRKLRDLIFASTVSKQALEKILHPRIRETVLQRVSQLDSAYCIIVIPLLFETSGYDFLDRTLVIDTSVENQIQRTVQRDSSSETSVRAILDHQLTAEQRNKNADDVIHNDGDLSSLERQIEVLHNKYLQLAVAD